MADVLRSCSKTACRWPAAASLSYRYATRQVWLLDLAPTSDPSLYDLCPHHADALTVPNGWERVDDRTVQEVMVEPSANDRAEEAARRRISAADPSVPNVRSLVAAMAGPAGPASPLAPSRNRYAELVDQLPRLAAEAGVPGATPGTAEPVTITAGPIADHPSASASASAPADLRTPTVIGPRSAPEPPAAPVPPPVPTASEPPLPPASAPVRPGLQHPRSGAPIPSRDLAPLPPAESSHSASEPPDAPLPGQLSIPVDVDDDDRGVVLPFDLAGGRRRTPRP